MSVGFYFTCKGKTIQLPVNPEHLTLEHSSDNRRTEVVALGEVSILRDSKLSGVTMSFLLPGDPGVPYLAGPWQQPMSVVKFFLDAMDSKRTVRLAVSDFGVSLKASVESVNHTRHGGDHDSIVCTVSLRQYRSFGALVLQIPTAPAAQSPASTTREVTKPAAKTYTVKPGDSFWRIAQQQLGNGSRYMEIATLNGMTAATIIHPGDVLRLP